MHRKLIALAATVSALTLAGAATAHVVVTPGQVEAGSFVTFTMSVPNEKAKPTTKVRLVIPEGVDVYAVEPVPGWRITLVKSGGRVIAIVVKGRLAPERFQRFAFLAAVPEQPTTLTWKAYQTYRGGEVVRWTGEPGDEEASTTTVVAASENQEGHHD